MAKKHIFQGQVDFNKYEALNMRLQTLFNWPTDPVEGQVLYRSDLKLGALYDGAQWLFFGLSADNMDAILNANSPDAANPFATLDDIPITPEDFIDLLDVPNGYTGEGGKFVAVKMTEDGLEFVTVSLDLSNYYTKAESDPLASTGSVIQFDRPRTYGGNIAPITATTLTENNTGLRQVTQVIFHQAASFTPPATWVKSTGSDDYNPAAVNVIYVEAFASTYKRYIIDNDV